METSAATSTKRTAPQLTFDDGSRAMQETAVFVPENRSGTARKASTPVREFYEIERLIREISILKGQQSNAAPEGSVWKNRIALQFPDDLLADAPEVCWEFELAFSENDMDDALVFCLGDTTYQSCCPDQVAAAHLQADCIIHYGHACLSSCTMPVLYSFGRASLDTEKVVSAVVKQIQQQSSPAEPITRLVLLYQTHYHAHMDDLARRIQQEGQVQVVSGQIPERLQVGKTTTTNNHKNSSKSLTRCGDGQTSCGADEGCCRAEPLDQSFVQSGPVDKDADDDGGGGLIGTEEQTSTGGLRLPSDFDNEPFTLLFVGDDSSLQFMNIVLRFLSKQRPPRNYWVWKPANNDDGGGGEDGSEDGGSLITELSPHFQRLLNRRFYMVQKARMASVFGILVANLSDRQMRAVVQSLDDMIRNHARTSYIFAVGKINPAKLANFGEIECFVLVACPEHSLLDNDSDFPTPVITPAELSLALGVTEWGQVEYSLDAEDYLKHAVTSDENSDDSQNEDSDDDDAPYFNPVSGQYESVPRSLAGKHMSGTNDDLNLQALPGQGVLTTYNSAAAGFLKQREYKGLQVEAGQTEVRIAVTGQQGIASKYSER